MRKLRQIALLFAVSSLLSVAPLNAQSGSRYNPRVPELDQLLESKESGLLTDWRYAGPFGRVENFSHTFGPERDSLKQEHYGSHRVVPAQFANGRFELPKNLPTNGVYYASSEVYLSNGGEWRLYAETSGLMQVFVDGKAVLARVKVPGAAETTSEVVYLERGEHKVLVKFTAAAAPFHVAVMPRTGGVRKRNNKPQVHASPDSEIVSAELRMPE